MAAITRDAARERIETLEGAQGIGEAQDELRRGRRGGRSKADDAQGSVATPNESGFIESDAAMTVMRLSPRSLADVSGRDASTAPVDQRAPAAGRRWSMPTARQEVAVAAFGRHVW